MAWWRRLRSRLQPSILRRRRDEQELGEEIDFHLAREAELRAERGVPPDEARAAARRDFGNVPLVVEATRAMWGWTSIERTWQDVRYACRTLLRTPGFTVVAILSLALGIGANTAVFQLLDAVRLRALPVDRPDELVEIQIASPRSRQGRFVGRRPELTYALWEAVRDGQQGLAGVFAWGSRRFNLSSGGEARYASGLWVSGDFFRVLGITPIFGRPLMPSDDWRGCDQPAAVVGYGFWQRELGGRPSVIGEALTLERHRFTIVGVTGPSFFGVEVGRSFDVAVPLCAEPLIAGLDSGIDKRDHWWLGAMGRLKPGWTREQAAAQLRSISAGLFEATLPPAYRAESAKAYLGFKLDAQPAASGVSTLRRDYETPLYILLAISALVLVIACANVANLMLARANGRQGELAIRVAVGASRTRLVHQLVTESLVLAVAGAAAGALVAGWVSRALVSFLTTERSPLHLELPMDLRVLGFLAALATVTCLASGLVPALRATRVTPARVIQAVGRGLTAHRERFRLQRALVVAQVALSVVLLVGALLFVRTLTNLLSVDLGFRPDNVLVVDVDLPGHPADERQPLVRLLHERLAAVPGVLSIAYTTIVPLSGSGSNNDMWMEGASRGTENRIVQMSSVSPGYFATVGTRLIAGRDFDARDTVESPRVAIVTERFVQTVAGGSDPIGRRVFEAGDATTPDKAFEIIGVVEDTKYDNVREDLEPIVFMAAEQTREPWFPTFLVRVAGPPAPVFDAVRSGVAEVNPRVILVFGVLADQIRQSLLRERLVAMLATAFATLAGLLVTLGLYGVLSYMVTRRRNEIGVRIALGARRGGVAGLFAREAGVLVLLGLAIGLALALATGRLATGLLFGLQPSDPATLAMAAAILSIIALLAAYVPAWRAARVDPIVALRSD